MRTCWPRRCSCRGFTVVEVLVAMTVMGVGMVGVFEAMRMANDAADRISDERAAGLLAERHMVALLAKPAHELRPARGVEGRFRWEENVRATKVPDLVCVVVKVRWETRKRPGLFELVSMRETR